VRILLSGFEPFGTFSVNPSQKLVESLLESPPPELELGGIILPVRYNEAPRLLLDKIRTFEPDAVVSFGVAGGSDELRLERVAVNWDESSVPDDRGDAPRGRTILAGGPAGIFSTLPLGSLLEGLEGQNLPARISQSAGNYLCNHLMYRTLLGLQASSPPLPYGFVHIPPTAEWNSGAGGAVRPFAHIRQAAERLLVALSRLAAGERA
jgi:pyroglutamyl-peptidase